MATSLNLNLGNKKFDRWRLLARTLLFFLSCAAVLILANPLGKGIHQSYGNLLIGLVAALGAYILTVLFVRWDEVPLSDVGASFAWRSLGRFFLGILIGLLLVLMTAAISAILGHVRWVRTQEYGFLPAFVNLSVFVALSCREELSFRGYPLLRLERYFGLWGAQTIVAVAFAAEHVAGGWPLSRAVFGAGIGSLLFGMAAISTRGLALPIGLHAAWNFGDWVLGGKDSSGFWTVVVEEGYQRRAQLIGTFAYVFVVLLATFAFWRWHRSRNNRSLSG